jgi:RNA polymerase sigma factor (sigma-70 family)
MSEPLDKEVARCGHSEDELVRKYEKACIRLTKRYFGFFGYDYDDLLQQARLAALKAIRTHDPRKASLTTHVFSCVRLRLGYLYELGMRPKMRQLQFEKAIASYDGLLTSSDGEGGDDRIENLSPLLPEVPVHEQVIGAAFLRACEALCETGVERDLIDYLSGSGEKMEEIGHRHGLSKSRISQIKIALVQKLRAQLPEWG